MISVTIGRPVSWPGNFQKLDALALEAGEIIGRGARFERAAPEHIGPGRLHGLGHGHDLLLGFHGAGTGHNAEIAAADLHIADLYDGIVGVVFAVAALERLGHALDAVDNVEAGDEVHIDARRVADEGPRIV